MAFNWIERHEKRQFHYTPRFYKNKEDEPVSKSGEDYDSDKFAERLHSRWSSRRMTQEERNKFPLKTVIWLMFIVVVLVFFFVKFMK